MVDLLGFFELANKLKWTDRRGWVVRLKVRKPESVADHSYLTAIMSMVIADRRGLNGNKAMKIALLHDLAESITGDYIPDDLSKKTRAKKNKEEAAMKSLLSKLPPRIRSNYTKLWREYRAMTSKESKLVNQLDKLEMALQANDYMKKGCDRELLEHFFLSAKAGIKDKELVDMLNSLKEGKT